MKAAIVKRAVELGFDACGFTTAAPPQTAAYFQKWVEAGYHGQMEWLQRGLERRCDPQKVLNNAATIIVVAAAYSGEFGSHPVRQARFPAEIARYARYKDYHKVMGEKLKELSRHVVQLGGPGTQAIWYVDTGPLLERDLAQRAGAGFIGKHCNSISRKLGNWFFLGEILSTIRLPPDTPEKNRCGSCQRCLDACPTKAIVAPFLLDARRCISYLTIELKGPIPVEFRPLIGNKIFGCDDCLAACPWNRFAVAGKLMEQYARPDLAAPDLLELIALGEAGFQQKFAGTPVKRLGWLRLLRNICVAIGNTGDSSCLPILQQAADNPDPIVAEHAQWAIAELSK